MSAGTDGQVEDHRALRAAAVDVVRQLVDAGHVAYFAGGCVRDRLMQREPDDYDIATSATPDQIKAVFPKAQGVGAAFGVMLVRQRSYVIEVATFRSEGEYLDGRRPESVKFTDAEHDAQRRDFTINGIFEDPLEDRIIDFVGGREDIDAGIIRAIGDPFERIREDRLRMLRTVRFAARFGFAIDPDTADAVRRCAHQFAGVSRERIGDEVRRMLLDQNRAVAAWEMQYLGLDEQVLQEPHKNVAPTRLGRLPENIAYPTALAAWMLDRHTRTLERDEIEAHAERWTPALMLSNRERRDLLACLDTYFRLTTEWPYLGVAAQKRLAAGDAFNPAMMIVQTTDPERFVQLRLRVLDLAETGLNPPRLVTGDDLIGAGFEPDPSFSDLLEAVYDAQLEGTIVDTEAGLALARSLKDSWGRSR